MKSPQLRLMILSQALVLTMGCSSALKVFNDNPLTNSLMKAVPGLTQLQAVGGAGALLGLAKSVLPSVDFSKVSGLVPHVDKMIDQAIKAGGMASSVKSFTDLGGTFSKLGMSADQTSKLVPATADFFTQKGGAEVGNMLAKVWK